MKIRDAIIAPPDHVIIELDYSQLETYCVAALTFDEVLVDELIRNVDLHTAAAQDWLKKEDISPDERRRAKALRFGLAYGATPHGLFHTTGSQSGSARSL